MRTVFLSACFLISAVAIAQTSLNYLSPTNTTPLSGFTDYRTNLWEEWVASRGIIPDVNNADIDSWTGIERKVVLSPVQTTEDIPVSGVMNINLTNGGFALPNNPEVNATDVTFVYLLRKPTSHNATSWLFDNVGPAPRYIQKFEISNADKNLGIQWNGVDLSFNAAFPLDNNFHVLVFRISGTTATCWIDGVQVGSTLNGLTGGSFAMNTSVTRRLLRGGQTILNPYNGDLKKIRIYLEAVSDANIAVISSQSNAFWNDLPQRNVRYFNVIGNSQSLGTGLPSELPGHLAGFLDRCFKFNTNTRVFEPMRGASESAIGPEINFAYKLSLKYPNDDIYIMKYAVGGTNLSSSAWGYPSGVYYTNNATFVTQAQTVLNIEQRNIIYRGGIWCNGETDSQDLTLSNAYQAAEAAMLPQWKTLFGHSVMSVYNLHGSYTGSYPYVSTVRAAKVTNSGSISGYNLLDTSLNPSRYQVSGDNVHFTTLGYNNIGEDMALNH